MQEKLAIFCIGLMFGWKLNRYFWPWVEKYYCKK